MKTVKSGTSGTCWAFKGSGSSIGKEWTPLKKGEKRKACGWNYKTVFFADPPIEARTHGLCPTKHQFLIGLPSQFILAVSCHAGAAAKALGGMIIEDQAFYRVASQVRMYEYSVRSGMNFPMPESRTMIYLSYLLYDFTYPHTNIIYDNN